MAMRDGNRLYKFYDELRDIHMTYFPDWRFGQMVVNVLSEWQSQQDRDIFYLEEDEILQIFKDYINNMK
jgi:hypothetical protein